MSEWISVEDRLPKVGIDVLVLHRGAEIDVALFNKEAHGWFNRRSYCIHPTHWMPLPEPPEDKP